MRLLLPLFLVLLLTVVLQVSAFPFLGLTPFVSLPLVACVFVVVFVPTPAVRWCAPLLGLTLDLYSRLPFGAHLLTLSIVVLLTELLYLQFFTNRSIYALLTLTAVATVVADLLLIASDWSSSFLRGTAFMGVDISILLWHLLGNAIALILLYYGTLSAQSLLRRFFFIRQPL